MGISAFCCGSGADAAPLGLRRQRDGAGDLGVGALGGLDDLLGCGVDELVIIGLETDADLLLCGCHVFLSSKFVRLFGAIGQRR